MKAEIDKNKQPGIKIEGIVLAESVFHRAPQVPDQFESSFSFQINNSFNDNGQVLATEFRAILNSENDPVYGNFVFVGIFSVDGSENVPLEKFAEFNSAAIIFPYVREEIHSRSIKAGLPQIILPPMNLYAAINNTPEH